MACETLRVIRQRFLPGIADLIIDYFLPRTMRDKHIAQAGVMELIGRITNYTEALRGACKAGLIGMARGLIAMGGDAKSDMTMRAAGKSGCMRMVKLVVRHGNVSWGHGIRAAGRVHHYDICDFLALLSMEVGLHVEGSIAAGNLERAISAGIHKYRYACPALNFACVGGNADIIDIVHSRWRSGRPSSDEINTALGAACRGGHMSAVNKMLALGATDYKQGLIAACQGNHAEVALFMISKGAPIRSGLVVACRKGYFDLARMLLDLAPDIANMLPDIENTTPLCYAGNIDIIKLLLTNGFTPTNITDSIAAAMRHNYFDIAYLLIDWQAKRAAADIAIRGANFCEIIASSAQPNQPRACKFPSV